MIIILLLFVLILLTALYQPHSLIPKQNYTVRYSRVLWQFMTRFDRIIEINLLKRPIRSLCERFKQHFWKKLETQPY